MAKQKLTAAYVRVSTRDGRQSTDAQRNQIEDYCRQQGLTVDLWFEDQLSGNQVSLKERDRMLKDVEAGKIGTVITVAIDRFSRDTPLRAAATIQRIFDANARLITVAQDFITSMPDAFKPLMITLMATLAHEESKAISRRVKAGLDKAKAEGQPLGRPRTVSALERLNRAIRDVERGVSVRQASVEHKVSKTTLLRRLAVHRQADQNPPMDGASSAA